MKGIAVNIQSANEYVAFALSSTLSVSKQDSLLLIWMCAPLFFSCSWRGVANKGIFWSPPAICSKALEAKLSVLPATAYALHESVSVYILIPPLTVSSVLVQAPPKSWTWAIRCTAHHSNAIHARSAAGDLLWLSCENVLMRHPSCLRWLLTASLQTDGSWRLSFWGPQTFLELLLHKYWRDVGGVEV